jgi:signal transduction histidine kinase
MTRRGRPALRRWLGGLLASVLMVAAVSGLVALLKPHLPPLYLLVLYVLVVLAVAIVWGTALAVVTSVLSAAVFAYLFVPPVNQFDVADWRSLAALAVFLVTAVVVGGLAARMRQAALDAQRLSEELLVSRARVVASADEARRQIARDLHDGAQQRLVTLALQLRMTQAAVPAELGDLSAELARVTAGLGSALDELREYARGIHPAVLTQHGLEPAVTMLARASPIPVELDLRLAGRLPEPIEVGAYYVVSEALTNTVKHAAASRAEVGLTVSHGLLCVTVRDNGRGGADLGRGTGLVGLKDRVEALRGRLYLDSPAGAGTMLRADLPLAATRSATRSAG